MVIKPKYRGFICTTAHPVGCEKNVADQIKTVKAKGRAEGPKRVLVVGASTGYGLAARIAAAYGFGADTVGVFFDKAGTERKTGTAGWYNNRAFEAFAAADGLKAASVNGDAFSDAVKAETLAQVRNLFSGGKIDLVVYSLAAPKRTDETGQTYNSVIKPIGAPYTGKTIDFHTGCVSEIAVEPASEQEITDTVKVMGGEDWRDWMRLLQDADLLAGGAKTVAFSYIGPAVTHAIYKDGTIGCAKLDLEKKATEINAMLAATGGTAVLAVNKAVVTQASAAIPVVPLYISILFKIMKEKGLHEDCAQQMDRLLREELYGTHNGTGESRLIRIDDREMADDVQQAVSELWPKVSTENAHSLTDIDGFRAEFFRLFGFEREDVDYEESLDGAVFF